MDITKIHDQVTNEVVDILDIDGKGTYNLSPIGFPLVNVSGEDNIPTLYVPSFKVTHTNPNSRFVSTYNIGVNIDNKSGEYAVPIEEQIKVTSVYDSNNGYLNILLVGHGYINGDILYVQSYNKVIDDRFAVNVIDVDNFQIAILDFPSPSDVLYVAKCQAVVSGELLDLTNQTNEDHNGMWYVGSTEWLNINELPANIIRYRTQTDIAIGGLQIFDETISSISVVDNNVTVVTADKHGYRQGTQIEILGTVNFNGTYEVIEVIDAITYAFNFVSTAGTETSGVTRYTVVTGDIIEVYSQIDSSANGLYSGTNTGWIKVAKFYEFDGTENDNRGDLYYSDTTIQDIDLSYNGDCVLGVTQSPHGLVSGNVIDIVSENGNYNGIAKVDVLSDNAFSYKLNTWSIPSDVGYALVPKLDVDGDVLNHYRSGYSHEEIKLFIEDKLGTQLNMGKIDGPLHKWLVGLIDVNIGKAGSREVIVSPFPAFDQNEFLSSSIPPCDGIDYDRGTDFTDIYATRNAINTQVDTKREKVLRRNSFAKWTLPGFHDDGVYVGSGQEKSASLRMYPEKYNKEFNGDSIEGGGHSFVNEDTLRMYIATSHNQLRPFSESMVFYQKNNSYHHNIVLDSSDDNMYGNHVINLVNNLHDVDTSINTTILTQLDDLIGTVGSSNIIKVSTVGTIKKYLYKSRKADTIEDFHDELNTLDWLIGTTYNSGEFAYYNGVVYESKGGSNLGNQPDLDDSLWRETTIIRFAQITDGVALDLNGLITIDIIDSISAILYSDIITILSNNNDMVPGIITTETDDELETIFIDNTLQDQLNNTSGVWNQDRNYQKKAFIHLPTNNVEDGEEMNINVTLPIKDPSLKDNFTSSTTGVLSAYKNYITQPRVYVMSGYQDDDGIDQGMPDQYNNYSYSKMPEMEYIQGDNVFHQRGLESTDIIGGNTDIRNICAVVYPTPVEGFSWRMDNDPKLRLLKEHMHNIGSLSGSASHIAYLRNQTVSSSFADVSDVLNIPSSEFALTYKFGDDGVYGYNNFMDNKNLLAVNIRTYLPEMLNPSDISEIVSDRDTYGSFAYQGNDAFRKLISDFYATRVSFSGELSTNTIDKVIGHSNATSSIPVGFYSGVINDVSIEQSGQTGPTNEDRWLTKALYAPEYIIEASSDTTLIDSDPFLNTSGAFKTYMSDYYSSNEEESNSGDRYVYGNLVPTLDSTYKFGRSSDNVIINNLESLGYDNLKLKDLKRLFWDTSFNKTIPGALNVIDMNKHRQYDYYNFGGGNAFSEYNTAFYGFYWNSFANLVSLEGAKPNTHDVELLISNASGIQSIEDTLKASLINNPVLENYLDTGDKFVSVNTSSNNTHLEEFLRNYMPGYSNNMPLRFYNSYRVLLKGDKNSSSHNDEYTNRVFKYAVSDYLSEYVDNGIPSDIQTALDDLVAVETINQPAIESEDINMSWGYVDDGNDGIIKDAITVSGNQYLYNSDYYNDLSLYSYLRVNMEFVYSKKNGRWACLGYKQTPMSYLTPTIGNVALSHIENSILFPGTKGDSVDDYVPILQPDIQNNKEITSVNDLVYTVPNDVTSYFSVDNVVYLYVLENYTSSESNSKETNGYVYDVSSFNTSNVGSFILDTSIISVITDISYDAGTLLTSITLTSTSDVSQNEIDSSLFRMAKQINTIDADLYPYNLNKSVTNVDYMWESKYCISGNSGLDYLYKTPYFMMEPMDINIGSIPFLSAQLPYNSDGSIKSFYNKDGEYGFVDNNDYRKYVLSKLSNNSSIEFVIPNNISGGEINPLPVYDFMPMLWKTYWHKRPCISSYQGTDVPGKLTRSGGDISDPVLGSMFNYVNLEQWESTSIPYNIPFHLDMSLNWLVQGYISKDANIYGNPNRDEYNVYDAILDVANRPATYIYNANRIYSDLGVTIQEYILDQTDQSLFNEVSIWKGEEIKQTTNFGDSDTIYSAAFIDVIPTSTRTLMYFNIPSELDGATILEATLTLSIDSWEYADNTDTVFYNIHKMLTSWTEGTGNTDGATYYLKDQVDDWNSNFIGLNDIDASVSIKSTASNNDGDTETIFDISNLVQDWVNTPASNNGVVIVNPDALDDQANNSTNLSAYPNWASSEFSVSSLRPKLYIKFKK